ncbi:MAG: AMP-binding protein [Nocardioidaceae bacterium]
MNLAENLDRTARARGRFPALRLGDQVTTFGEVDSWSRRVAGFLAGHGIRPGDRVGLMLPDVWEFAVLYYGILRLGAIVVPLDAQLAERGVHHRLQDSGSRAVVVWAPLDASVRPAARALGVVAWALEPGGLLALLGDVAARDLVEPRSADDLAVISYTAGTTGEPRGAALTHDNLLRNCEVVVNDLLQLTSEDVVLCGLALSHPFGQTLGLNAAVRAGACLVLLARWDAGAILDTLRDQAVTVLEGPPTLYDEVLHDPRHTDHDLPPLRICVSGIAAMPTDVQLRFEEAFHCLVLEAYGLAETSPLASFNRRDRRRVGSIGVPATGVELRVLDDTGSEVGAGEPGEIVVRGANVMSGYWDRPEQTAATVVDGWLRTGDVGVRDEDGFFFVVDRLQELITRDGRRVFPRAVEAVLHEHEAVADAAVIGVPHPELGEEVHAVVTLHPGAITTPGELRDFVLRRLGPHTSPREVDIVEQMPKSSTGEILKRAIRLESRA